ncbi:MAG: GDP-L-fucose synthase family protein [Thermodesulfobacteriota bacterium]
MNHSAKIYVAGHRGLVGSALLRCLHAGGHHHIITRSHAELDLTDQAAVAAFFAAERPEFVFLAAAKVGGILANDTWPADFLYQNLAIQQNVIHQAWQCGVKRLLFLGSSCIYPRDCPQPMREEYLLTGPLEATNRAYAVAKIAGIEMCRAYNCQYGTGYLAVMPTNLYGPGDNYDLEKSHVLPALIRKFHLAKLAAEGNWRAIEEDETANGLIPVEIRERLRAACVDRRPSGVLLWGSGSPRREFLYSDDMAEACVLLMNLPEPAFSSLLTPHLPPLINIGCGEDLTIRELTTLVAEAVGYAGPVEWDATKPDGTPRKLLSVDRLFALGWRPRRALAEGIRLAYADFLARGMR